MINNGHVLPEDLDLNDIFIGRERELKAFRFYLENWRWSIKNSLIPPLTLPPSPTRRIPGFFVLLHGRGGFGKSTLLAHYHQIALEKNYPLQVSEIIDWEATAQQQRAIFNIKGRENIDFYQYFQLIATKLAAALHKQPRDFSMYRMAEQAADQARKQAYNVLDQLQMDESFSWLRGTGVARDALLALVSMLSPGIEIILSNDLVRERTQALFDTGTGIGIKHVQRLGHSLRERLGKNLGSYLDAHLQLGLALGKDLARFSERSPLLIFFDTYEEIDEGDWLLRICMGAAGERVGWVISGRDNLWAGMTQMQRSVEAEYGYRDLVSPERSYIVDFSADGVGNLTPFNISAYFQQICEKTGLPMPSGDPLRNSVRILEITQGIPLAVRIVASLYLEMQDLALITENIDQRRAIVEQMVQRYLIHTRDSPSDRTRLYALALPRQIDDPSLIAVALGIPAGQELEGELRRLHRRYGFIFTRSGRPLMHQEVRHFLRLWLMQNRARPEIIHLIQRLQQVLVQRLAEREKQYSAASLRKRLEDTEWRQLYLDLTELEFWLAPATGVSFLLAFMCAASIYQREANREARPLGQFFDEIIPEPARISWKWADSSLVFLNNRGPLRDELDGLRELVRLADRNGIAFAQPILKSFSQELEAALWWRLGEAYSANNVSYATYWYGKAKRRLPHEEELRKAYEDAVSGHSTQSVLPRTLSEYLELGDAYLLNHDSQRAAEHFSDALNADENCTQAYVGRGIAYRSLGDFGSAIVDFDHALSLDPDNIPALSERSEAYERSGDLTRAIQDLERASQLAPNDTTLSTKLQSLQTQMARVESRQNPPQRRKRRLTWLLTAGVVVGLILLLVRLVISPIIFFPPVQSKPPGCRVASANPPSSLPQQMHSSSPQSLQLLSVTSFGKEGQGVAWSPHGDTLVSSDKGHAYIWHTYNDQLQLLSICQGSDGSDVWRVAWSPDGQYIASGSDDGTVRIWNAANRDGVFLNTGKVGNVRGLAWNPKGHFIAAGYGDASITIWNVTDPLHVSVTLTLPPQIEKNGVYGLAWSHDGNYLAVPYGDGTVEIWNVHGPKPALVSDFNKHANTAYFVAWSQNDKDIASVSTDRWLRVWDVAKGQAIWNADLGDSVFCVAWSQNGEYIATTVKDDSVHVYKAQDGSPIAMASGIGDYMYGASWAPDSNHLVTTDNGNHIYVWQLP